MSKLDEMLSQRTRPSSKQYELTKVQALAERANEGQLSGFGGLFKEPELTEQENQLLREILLEGQEVECLDIEKDLAQLRHITKEIKAIHTQAILLHGERIKQAQVLLKTYKEGAFSRWLVAAYGNRQTPYNFLQFFEFFQTLSIDLKKKAEQMPRQAIYSLATRKGPLAQKQQILLTAEGKTKNELLAEIRVLFPLNEQDKRKSPPYSQLFLSLVSLEKEILQKIPLLSTKEKGLLLEKAQRVIDLLG